MPLAISRIAGEIHPRDSFILFAAGHGVSSKGRFYLIPHDYNSAATSLRDGAIGQDALHTALREYSRRWLLKHPTPLDFFNTVEDVAGRDLDWFWHPWWYETAVMDQAIADVEISPGAAGETVVVTVEDRGDAPMPVLLAVTLEDGDVRRLTVPVDVWLEGARRHRVELEVPGRVARVDLDPDDVLLDVDRTNDAWVRSTQQR